MSLSLNSLQQLEADIKRRLENGESKLLLKNEYLGRNGTLAQLLKELPNLPTADKQQIGQEIAPLKQRLTNLLSESLGSQESADLTLPLTLLTHGHEHPVQHTISMLYQVYGKLGFTQFLTPEIEQEEHNFDSLRVAKDHPARDMQDTFWTTEAQVLRTHTTAFQKRALTQLKPPFAVMQGGKIYRAEAEDATHLSEFHQFDGFAVANDLSFADLKGVMLDAMQQLFGEHTRVRFRPSFFPFVEPGAELDIQCIHCNGSGCKSCGHKGWLEMFGCGMTHPQILEDAGLDSRIFSGIAFGIGVERVAMVKYGVTDIREFIKNDPRFLEQLA